MSKPAMKVELDPAQRGKIEELRRQEKDTRIYVRYSALLRLADRLAIEQIASFLGPDPSTVRGWIRLYNTQLWRGKMHQARQRDGCRAWCDPPLWGD